MVKTSAESPEHRGIHASPDGWARRPSVRMAWGGSAPGCRCTPASAGTPWHSACAARPVGWPGDSAPAPGSGRCRGGRDALDQHGLAGAVSPTSAVSRPAEMSRSTPASACTGPNFVVTPRTRSSGVPAGLAASGAAADRSAMVVTAGSQLARRHFDHLAAVGSPRAPLASAWAAAQSNAAVLASGPLRFLSSSLLLPRCLPFCPACEDQGPYGRRRAALIIEGSKR